MCSQKDTEREVRNTSQDAETDTHSAQTLMSHTHKVLLFIDDIDLFLKCVGFRRIYWQKYSEFSRIGS